MSTLTITLSDDCRAKLREIASRSGCKKPMHAGEEKCAECKDHIPFTAVA